ncbi:hypothetical protein CDAR_541871 [Caerostris darwini]|uniref:Uncharacterized protein n=1 Tax=Caerostris darwini TaxID=1538125 RepID=A0AAV4UUK6_9ARAC|nr:hypothetical protein CDAR_541871 [Caerostris darwini]
MPLELFNKPKENGSNKKIPKVTLKANISVLSLLLFHLLEDMSLGHIKKQVTEVGHRRVVGYAVPLGVSVECCRAGGDGHAQDALVVLISRRTVSNDAAEQELCSLGKINFIVQKI